MNHSSTLQLYAGAAGLEREGIPEETGKGLEKQIKKVGTQFCITSDGVDKNFGCYPSKEKAKAVREGKSFITPDIDAGGPGSGRHPEFGKFTKSSSKEGFSTSYDTKHTNVTVYHGTSPVTVYEQNTAPTGRKREAMGQSQPRKIGQGTPEQAKAFLKSKYGIDHDASIKAGGPGSGRHKVSEVLEQKGWQRTRDLGDAALYRHPDNRHDKIAVDDRYETWSHGVHIGSGSKDLAQHLGSLSAVSYGKYGVKVKTKSPYRKSEPGGSKPINISPPKLKLGPHVGGEIKHPGINADQGEPLAGMYQHADFDTNLWFHPPSLKNPTKVPTDDPGEKNNRFLDVDKRNSKDTKEQRMKLLKRQSPGPNVPVRTTLISPNLNSYMPMNASAIKVHPRFKVRPRADLNNAVMRRSYSSAKI